MAGVLASIEPDEWLSIYDHPESWRGFDRETVLSMRKHLYRFVIPIDAREMQPEDYIHSLQTISLSVAPVALGVEVSDLPPHRLHALGSQLPSSPIVQATSLEILSHPEISRVAERICKKDIPASEGVWQLLGYDYSLEQVTRWMSLGMLGRKKNRRIIPLRSAFKAVIDAFIDRSVIEFVEKETTETVRLYIENTCGDSFIVLSRPGEPRVDYLSIENTTDALARGVSLEGPGHVASDPKTSVYADHARYSAYRHMNETKLKSHIIIFHYSQKPQNRMLGPWLVRAGVHDALQTSPVRIDDARRAVHVLESVLQPGLDHWSVDIPLHNRLGIAAEAVHASSLF